MEKNGPDKDLGRNKIKCKNYVAIYVITTNTHFYGMRQTLILLQLVAKINALCSDGANEYCRGLRVCLVLLGITIFISSLRYFPSPENWASENLRK